MQIRNPTTDSPTAAKQNASSPQQLTTFAPSAREAEHKLQLIKFHKGTCWPQRCWGLHDLPIHTIFNLLHTANPQVKKIKFCHNCPCWQGPGGDCPGPSCPFRAAMPHSACAPVLKSHITDPGASWHLFQLQRKVLYRHYRSNRLQMQNSLQPFSTCILIKKDKLLGFP